MSDDACRLFLITPVLDKTSAFAPAIEAAVSSGDVACVLLRHSAMDEGDAKKLIRTIAPIVQKYESACLIEDDPRIAVRADVDGVHVKAAPSATEDGEANHTAIADALEQLKPNRIVGAGRLVTRDDAMVAGESGVDYLMFGDPDGSETPESILERVAWWAGIFNVPCVGFAHNLAEVADLVRAGADFVAVSDALWNDQRGIEPTMKEILQLLADTRETA